jgi:hypothetical protein
MEISYQAVRTPTLEIADVLRMIKQSATKAAL